MSILTGVAINNAIENGSIIIGKFKPENVGPNSYDLTLQNKISYYPYEIDRKTIDDVRCDDSRIFTDPHTNINQILLDPRSNNPIINNIIPDDGFILQPHILYLCETNESVYSDKFVAELSGVSSLARLGLEIHQTAGYANIGHEFKWVLEITVTHPLKIYPDMKIAQMYFHTIEGEVLLYDGKYKNKQMDDNICGSLMYEDNR